MACACSCLRPAPASAGLKAASVTASLRYISCMASRLIGRGRHRGERRLRAGPATVASAVVKAPASASEVIEVLQDMVGSHQLIEKPVARAQSYQTRRMSRAEISFADGLHSAGL